MVEAEGTSKKHNAQASETKVQNLKETESTNLEEQQILATGLEDYGRWKSMFKDHKRDKNEKPFRRGRIWC